MLPIPDQLPDDHRSGYVAVVGRPNVGKSTLLNRLLGQKIAITSPKPQTTRDQILGIYTTKNEQILFLDTPGIHEPKHRLGEYMVDAAVRTLGDADVLLWLVDINTLPTEADRRIADLLREQSSRRPLPPIVLGLNKTDQWGGEEVGTERRIGAYLTLLDWLSEGEQGNRRAGEQGNREAGEQGSGGAEEQEGSASDVVNRESKIANPNSLTPVTFSAITGRNVDKLLNALRKLLPQGPRYYPEEQVTDVQTRFVVAELIRERALHHLHEEVPHSIAVAVEEFSERSAEMTYILATIYVERASQKKIVLGEGGQMIKRIGQAARPEIEALVGTKVYLELWVKVWEKWRKRAGKLRQLGYAVEK